MITNSPSASTFARLVISAFLIGSLIDPQPASATTILGAEELFFSDFPPVVIASGKAESLENAPANVTVVTGQEMRERGYRTLIDLIPDLPGSTVIPFSGDLNDYPNPPFGNTATRGVLGGLKLMINGLEVDPRHGGNTIWEERFPIEGIDHVEFIVGPYSSLYGRNTYSGVMNVVLKTGEQVNGGSVAALYGNSTEYNTVNQGQGTLLLGRKWGRTDVYASAFTNQSRNGLDMAHEYPGIYGDGVRDNGAFDGAHIPLAPGISSKYIMPWNHHETYLSVKHDSGFSFDGQYAFDGGPNIVPRFNPHRYVADRNSDRRAPQLNGRVKYANTWGRLGLEFSVAGQDWSNKYINLYRSGRIRRIYARSSSQRANTALRYKMLDSNELLLSVSRENVREYPSVTEDNAGWPALRRNDDRYFNFSLQDEARFGDKAKVVAGFMYEHNTRAEDVILPRLSFLWSPTADGTVKLLYGEGYVSPSRDLQEDNPGSGIKGASPSDIKPARIRSYDLQGIQKMGKSKISASVFYTQQQDFVAQIADASLPAPYTTQWKNTDGLRETYGTDVEVRTAVSDLTKAFLSYSYVNGWSTSQTRNEKQHGILYAPRHMVKVGINQLLWNKKLNLYAHDILNGRSSQWQGAPNLGKSWMGSYNVVDVNLGTTEAFHKALSFSVGVRNLLNKEGFFTRPLATTGSAVDDHFQIDVPIRKRYYTVQAGYKF
jgi:outer membrane receptor for ferrienterochelin and colicins